KKEHYALNHIFKQEHKKYEEEQIKDNINNCNKMIDGGEKKFITSLLNRDKRTIILNRARSITSDNSKILLTSSDKVKAEAINIFSGQFKKRNHKLDDLLPEHWE